MGGHPRSASAIRQRWSPRESARRLRGAARRASDSRSGSGTSSAVACVCVACPADRGALPARVSPAGGPSPDSGSYRQLRLPHSAPPLVVEALGPVPARASVRHAHSASAPGAAAGPAVSPIGGLAASPLALASSVASSVASSLAPASPTPRVARRARAWYSGPCFRGSAYSRGLIVQYVPEDGPYHAPPSQSGSSGSAASSYVVEPGLAVLGPRRAWCSRLGRSRFGPLPADARVPPLPDPVRPPDVAVPPMPEPRARQAARDARAREGSALDSRAGSARRGRGCPGARSRPSLSTSLSYAAWIDRNRGSARSPAASGWYCFTSRR